MVRSFMREKKIYCGDHYREVDIYSYTDAQKKASGRGKRSKKVKESEPKQKNLNDKISGATRTRCTCRRHIPQGIFRRP